MEMEDVYYFIFSEHFPWERAARLFISRFPPPPEVKQETAIIIIEFFFIYFLLALIII